MMEFLHRLNRKFTIGYYLARSLKTNALKILEQGTGVYQQWINTRVESGYHFAFATKDGELVGPQMFNGITLIAGFAFGNFKNKDD